MTNSRIPFDGKGPLAAAIRTRGGNPSVRTAQQEYVQQLERCLDHGWPAFIDAETGVGKTLGYLVPMLEAALNDKGDRRPLVVISTATVALQQQLISSDLPLALDAVERADVLVVNHHLLSLHLLRPFLWSEDRSVHLVVDEADRLPDAVESIRRTQVPMRNLLHEAKCLGRDAAPISTLIEAAMDLMSTLWSDAWQGAGGGVVAMSHMDPRRREGLISILADLSDGLAGAVRSARLLHTSLKDRESLATLDRYGDELDRMVKSARMGDLNRSVLYYSPVRRYPGVAILANGASRIIAKGLWRDNNEIKSLLFTSATLSTLAQGPGTPPKRALAAFSGSIGFMPEELPIEAFAVIAPQRFGEMGFVRPLLEAPVAFVAREEGAESVELSEAALDYWSRMVAAAHDQGGRTLVLLPSYRDVMALSSRLQRFGEDLVAQVPGYLTGAAVKRFLDREGSIWVSASAWEGVSLPGAISHIVIPRLPIRPLTFEDSVVQEYVTETYGSNGRSVIFARQMADARRRLRQGVGRGIRSHEDKVTIWIGDPRWPITQREADEMLMDQPRPWSTTMANAISARFRRKLENSMRFEGGVKSIGKP